MYIGAEIRLQWGRCLEAESWVPERRKIWQNWGGGCIYTLRSLFDKGDLQYYTNTICDRDNRTFLLLYKHQTHGPIPLSKDDRVNHVQKLGNILCALGTKNSENQLTGDQEGPTQDLIYQIARYSGIPPRGSDDVKHMQSAVNFKLALFPVDWSHYFKHSSSNSCKITSKWLTKKEACSPPVTLFPSFWS